MNAVCRCIQASKSRDLVEANLVVYSVTDRASFQYAQSCLQELRPAKRHNVVILVANKQDIVRNRVISEQGLITSSTPCVAWWCKGQILLRYLVRSWFEAGRRQVRSWSSTNFEPVCDQLRTS